MGGGGGGSIVARERAWNYPILVNRNLYPKSHQKGRASWLDANVEGRTKEKKRSY